MYFTGQKICLITGANSGIGRAAAEVLAKLGMKLLLVARNHHRGEAALKSIRKISGNNDIELFIADLSSQNSIRQLADDIKRKYDRVDILINNAGAYFSKRHVTEDNVEAAFAVNYLSRFLLTNLLLDLLLKSKYGRIINVSGEYHRRGNLNFDDLQLRAGYSGFKANAQAKLADVVFAYELAKRLSNTNVTVNSLHPGAVATNIVLNDPDLPVYKKSAYKLLKPFLSSPEKGAETLIYLAVSPEVVNVTGGYFIDKKIVTTSPGTYNAELAGKLWTVSEQLTGLKENYFEFKKHN